MSIFDKRRARQIMPFGRPLPVMIDCIPTIYLALRPPGFIRHADRFTKRV